MRRLAQLVVITAAMLLAQCGLVDGDVITVDPNTSEAGATAGLDALDPRLAQKISYECRTQPTRKILDDLSSKTGVSLISGKGQRDWQVRDAKMIIAVKDVTLAELMNSIARVMRFKWSISGEGQQRSYRLVNDDEAVRKAEAQQHQTEQGLLRARKKAINAVKETAALSEEELAQLKTTNSYLYWMGISGLAKAYVNLSRQIPELESAIINQSDLTLPQSQLSAGARQAMREIIKTGWRARTRNEPFPPELEDIIDKLAIQISESESEELPSMYARGDLGGFDIGDGKNGVYFSFALADPNNGVAKTEYKYRVTYLEEGREAARNSVTPEDREISDSWQKDMYIEPLTDHPNLPELSKKVSVEWEDQKEKVFLAASRKLGLNLVSDSYKRYQYLRMWVSLKDADIFKVLDTLTYRDQSAPPYNWDKPSSIVEISHRNWYFQRRYEIPDAWIAEWRRVVEETGTLDLDQLAEMAVLTGWQYRLNVGNDKILKNQQLNQQISRNREYLKVYATLSKSQRSAMLSRAGLSLAALDPAQQQVIFKIISGMDMPDDMSDLKATGLDVRATASHVQEGKRFIYTFCGNINGVPLPGEYILSTPIYEDYPKEPDTTSEKERK